jgi:RimJ/RimL family protein N-acetyltransferase
MVRFGFEALALSQLMDSCDRENVASARVMEKCGFSCEGERDGERLYTLTADAWQQMQKVEVPNQA